MAKPRKPKVHIPVREKLAAALLMCMQPDASGKLARVISHEEAKGMTAKQIIARFDFHHWPIEEQDGGPAAAWNLSPLPRKVHHKETGKLRKQRAKGKRIREKYNTSQGAALAATERLLEHEFDRQLSGAQQRTAAIFDAVTAPRASSPEPKRRGRPMPGGRASPHKRTMRGKVVLRNQPEART